MPVGWALVGHPGEPAKVGNLRNLKNLALQAGKPWAQKVEFTVTEPLTVFWHQSPKKTRQWQACVEIGDVTKADLLDIYQFIEQNCSHTDGFG